MLNNKFISCMSKRASVNILCGYDVLLCHGVLCSVMGMMSMHTMLYLEHHLGKYEATGNATHTVWFIRLYT
jgi:hypothetical protein